MFCCETTHSCRLKMDWQGEKGGERKRSRKHSRSSWGSDLREDGTKRKLCAFRLRIYERDEHWIVRIVSCFTLRISIDSLDLACAVGAEAPYPIVAANRGYHGAGTCVAPACTVSKHQVGHRPVHLDRGENGLCGEWRRDPMDTIIMRRHGGFVYISLFSFRVEPLMNLFEMTGVRT